MSDVPAVSAIADVLALWGHDGWLTPPLVPVVEAAAPTIGRARTIGITVGPTGPGMTPIYELLSNDLKGRIVVLAGAHPVPGAVFGELLGLAAQQSGAAGVLVDGGVRDRPDMAELGLPVYARDQRVVGPNGLAHVTSFGQPVAIDTATGTSVSISDADHLVIDPTGCVRIAASVGLDAVLDAARRYAAAEALVASVMAEGESLRTAYRHKKAVVDELKQQGR